VDADGQGGLVTDPCGVDDPMPVFVIKAKDDLAIHAIREYHDLCVERGLDDQANEVEAAIDEMIEWRDRHEDEIKPPDHRHVPVSDGTGQ
jgi:hypothetical protein